MEAEVFFELLKTKAAVELAPGDEARLLRKCRNREQHSGSNGEAIWYKEALKYLQPNFNLYNPLRQWCVRQAGEPAN